MSNKQILLAGLLLAICLISPSGCQQPNKFGGLADTTTTAIIIPTTESTTETTPVPTSTTTLIPIVTTTLIPVVTTTTTTTTPVPVDTTTTTTTTTSTTTTSITSMETTTEVPTTTTKVSTTTTTTTLPTTTIAPPLVINNFTIPKNDSAPPCLKLVTTLQMNIKYKTDSADNGSATFTLPAIKEEDYDGECSDSLNTLSIKWGLTSVTSWNIKMNYTLSKTQYSLTGFRFDYYIDPINFPRADPSILGFHSVELDNLTESSTYKGNSYKCTSLTKVPLNSDITVEFSNYQAEAFMDKSKKTKDFDIATSCPADITGQSKLVPIIVGSCLAALVILVLIAYIIGRRKHRPGYQQV